MLTRQRRPQLNSRSSRRFNTLDGMPLIDHPMPMTMEDHPMPVYDHPPMPMPPIYEDKNGGGFQPVPIMPPIIAPPPHKLETDHPPQMILNDNPDSPFGNNNGVAGQEADNGEEMSGWQKALKVASGALKGLEDSADRQPVQPITPIVLPTIQTHPYFADPYRMQQPQALSQGGRMMPGMQYRIGAEKVQMNLDGTAVVQPSGNPVAKQIQGVAEQIATRQPLPTPFYRDSNNPARLPSIQQQADQAGQMIKDTDLDLPLKQQADQAGQMIQNTNLPVIAPLSPRQQAEQAYQNAVNAPFKDNLKTIDPVTGKKKDHWTKWERVAQFLDGWVKGGLVGGITEATDRHYFEKKRQTEATNQALQNLGVQTNIDEGNAKIAQINAQTKGIGDRVTIAENQAKIANEKASNAEFNSGFSHAMAKLKLGYRKGVNPTLDKELAHYGIDIDHWDVNDQNLVTVNIDGRPYTIPQTLAATIAGGIQSKNVGIGNADIADQNANATQIKKAQADLQGIEQELVDLTASNDNLRQQLSALNPATVYGDAAKARAIQSQMNQNDAKNVEARKRKATQTRLIEQLSQPQQQRTTIPSNQSKGGKNNNIGTVDDYEKARARIH